MKLDCIKLYKELGKIGNFQDIKVNYYFLYFKDSLCSELNQTVENVFDLKKGEGKMHQYDLEQNLF